MDVPAPGLTTSPRAEIEVDLDAVRHNVRRLRELVWGAEPAGDAGLVMVVVKADGYGHGLRQVAGAARQAGAEWLGVATPEEALELRAAGDDGRVLCWLAAPGQDFAPLVAADVDVTAYTVGQLAEVVRAAREVGRPARLQLKLDTGLSRGGAVREDWLALATGAKHAQDEGDVVVTGLWSHLACADEPTHPANQTQLDAFADGVALVRDVGLEPEVCHLANSAGALLHPAARHDLVRLGIAVYGLSPAPEVVSGSELGLVPAMTVRARVVMAKELHAGDGISYGHTAHATEGMRVALVPLGYADGIPRHASSRAEVLLDGARAPVVGRVCMDQLVVAAPEARAGDEVVLFGPGVHGEPTATDWARWCGTIDYEIVARMRGRQHRTWTGEEQQ